MSQPTRIAIVETFDVSNFGDLLFHLSAAKEIEDRAEAMKLVCWASMPLFDRVTAR